MDTRGVEQEDFVRHFFVHINRKLTAYCFAYANYLKKEIIPPYHVEAKIEECLKQLLIKTINNAKMKDSNFYS